MTEMTDTYRPLSSTERARLCRQRRRDGKRVIPVEIFDHEIEEMVSAGLLAPEDAAEHWLIGLAVAKIIESWVEERESRP